VDNPVVEVPEAVDMPAVEAPAVEEVQVPGEIAGEVLDIPAEAPVIVVEQVEAPAVQVEAPAVEAPAVEAPAVEAPAVEAPAVDAPAVDAPAEAPDVGEPQVEGESLLSFEEFLVDTSELALVDVQLAAIQLLAYRTAVLTQTINQMFTGVQRGSQGG
jgi:hypothetical protein